MGDMHAPGRIWKALNNDAIGGNVDHALLILDKKVMMIGCVGIKIGTRRINRDLTQQARLPKLMQGIVNGGQGDRHIGVQSFTVKLFCAYMSVWT